MKTLITSRKVNHATLKKVEVNIDTTADEIENINTGDRIIVEESGVIGVVFSAYKEDGLYTITVYQDKGLFTEVFLKRPVIK